MQRTAATADPDADRLVFVVTDPAPDADLYDYPGEYALRSDGTDTDDGMSDLASWAGSTPLPAGEYVNDFECIPDG